MNYQEFILIVESKLQEIIKRCYPASWDENHITFTITDEFAKDFKHITIDGLERPFHVRWGAHKLRRPVEETLGDLAILVHIDTWEGESIEGVGILEAKLRASRNSSFKAVKKRQLQRILSRSSHSRLLLYDYSQITEFTDNVRISSMWEPHFFRDGYGKLTMYSHSATLPVGVALSVGSYNTSLYKFCMPFSIQLCTRYFRGYDLEMNPKVISDIKGNSGKYGGFRNLWVIGISTSNDHPALPSGINTEIYESIT